MKRHPITPFLEPQDLSGIDLEAAEQMIHGVLAKTPRMPLNFRPHIDRRKLRMVERHEVKIEEIGDKL